MRVVAQNKSSWRLELWQMHILVDNIVFGDDDNSTSSCHIQRHQNNLDWNIDMVFAAGICRTVETKIPPWTWAMTSSSPSSSSAAYPSSSSSSPSSSLSSKSFRSWKIVKQWRHHYNHHSHPHRHRLGRWSGQSGSSQVGNPCGGRPRLHWRYLDNNKDMKREAVENL